MKRFHFIRVLVFCLLVPSAIHAHNNIVVIPMGGDADHPASVAATGQTTCYKSPGVLIPCSDPEGQGQDGDLQFGVAWPDPRFMDNGDGTVTDNLTGLIWLKNANCIATQIPNYDGDGLAGDGKVTRDNALDFISGFNKGGIISDTGALYRTKCGDTSNNGQAQNDWRLPNRFELESLLDLSQGEENDPPTIPSTPALPVGHLFENVEIDAYYWSSSYSSYFRDLGVGWAVSFSGGDVSSKSWALDTLYVWPVRGGN